jgi:hypothetical protein
MVKGHKRGSWHPDQEKGETKEDLAEGGCTILKWT